MPARVLGVDHVAVVVEDLDEAVRLWRDVLGLRPGGRETVESDGVEVQMMYAGDTRVELVHPLRPDSPAARHLARRGPGLHHLALAVEDCAEAAAAASAAGARMVDAAPRPGAHGTRVAFVHPSAAGGVLAEFVAGGAGPWIREQDREVPSE
jgi:methylmalonyl-CoA/ethylmalonyl-CoA epimerase